MGKSLCEKHAQKKRNDQKKIRENRQKLGTCTMCGKIRDNNTTQCTACKKQQNDTRIIRFNKRKEMNQCTMCGRSKSFVKVWTNLLCAGCHLRQKFGWSGTKEESEQIINNLLEKQNYLCALSGRDLRTNKYHIDHIISRSADDSLVASPDNWQLIVEEANYFKKNKTNKELIDIALDITIENIRRGVFNIENILSKI